MLYAVTLTYLTQPDAISAHLDAHKQWLVRGFKEGKILFAGPSAIMPAATYFLKETMQVKFNTVFRMTPSSCITLPMQK
jgi:hypothetical protein